MMEERKKPTGRPQIYTGEMSELAQRMEDRRRAEHEKAAGEPERTAGEAEKAAGEAEKAAGEAEKAAGGPEKTVEEAAPGSAERTVPVGHQAEKAAPAGRQAEKSVQKRRLRFPDSLNPPAKRKREQENLLKMQTLGVILGVLIVALIIALVYEVGLGHGTKQTGNERMAAQAEARKKAEEASLAKEQDKDSPGNTGGSEDKSSGGTDTAETGENAQEPQAAGTKLMEQAKLKEMQYDYDGAAELLKSAEGYAENEEYQAAVSRFEQEKAACVPYPASDVTHIFFHTLIHDAAKAFDGDQYQDGYNQYMVTEREFNSIIQQMYDRGYVMVFLDEIVPKTEDSNGNTVFAAKDIMLPPDRKPFVLSQDDVSYYHYMDGDGFASRLIVDENGDVKNEYIEEDGSVSVGDYDLVPLIDRFVEQHPDFSYHGQKGYIALTGYEGILGYRTDEVYKTKQEDRITFFQQQFFDSYPGGFDEAAFEQECEGAKKVAEAMKANGWKFASHTWGHQNLHETNGISYDSFTRDTDRWETWVEPLIGETDTLIYAFGGDIRGAEPYSGDRFNYLKQSGFDYFCGVDSAVHWLQVGTDYVRQSRRNVDGYRMYYNPDMLDDLFDVSEAWDPLRPSSVPPI